MDSDIHYAYVRWSSTDITLVVYNLHVATVQLDTMSNDDRKVFMYAHNHIEARYHKCRRRGEQ